MFCGSLFTSAKPSDWMYALRPGDVVVGHDLLEPGVAPLVVERQVRAVRGTVASRDVCEVAVQVAAAVEVRENDVLVRGQDGGEVMIVVVGEGLVPQGDDRVRVEDAAGPRVEPGDALAADHRAGGGVDQGLDAQVVDDPPHEAGVPGQDDQRRDGAGSRGLRPCGGRRDARPGRDGAGDGLTTVVDRRHLAGEVRVDPVEASEHVVAAVRLDVPAVGAGERVERARRGEAPLREPPDLRKQARPGLRADRQR